MLEVKPLGGILTNTQATTALSQPLQKGPGKHCLCMYRINNLFLYILIDECGQVMHAPNVMMYMLNSLVTLIKMMALTGATVVCRLCRVEKDVQGGATKSQITHW